MFKVKCYFIVLLASISFDAYSQANLLNAVVPQDVGKLSEKQEAAEDNEPLSYGYIDDRDVLWSKTVWEIIDLSQRINFSYYYPTDTLNLGTNRRSLFAILKKNLENGEITEVYDDSYFRVKLTYPQIQEKLVAIDTLDAGFEQLNAGEALDPQYINRRDITSRNIAQYRIKGTWYFNKRLAELRFRLLGIAPVAPDVYSLDKPPEEQDLIPLFWVWFPNARDVLNKETVFNTNNSSQPVTFDLMLNARRFIATIYKEDNIYEDREINEYVIEDALLQLIESEKIKTVIRDFELDMWSN